MPIPMPELRAPSVDRDIESMFFQVRRGIIASYVKNPNEQDGTLWPVKKATTSSDGVLLTDDHRGAGGGLSNLVQNASPPKGTGSDKANINSRTGSDADGWRREIEKRYFPYFESVVQAAVSVANEKDRKAAQEAEEKRINDLDPALRMAMQYADGEESKGETVAPSTSSASTSTSTSNSLATSQTSPTKDPSRTDETRPPKVAPKASGWLEAARRFSKPSAGGVLTRRTEENPKPLSVAEMVLSKTILQEITGGARTKSKGELKNNKVRFGSVFAGEDNLLDDFASLLHAYTQSRRQLEETQHSVSRKADVPWRSVH
ncbi:unnamed protein product [Amoebophrya sp. A25]|nr:unnamed protein product [Amoebophrya sp. A25]|eukprot:GSA25T00006926001.1